MNTPTLIGMPEPPSNPDTPTETPGTPNSTTTSLSALSTTAFKDGHKGNSFPHAGHGHRSTPSSNTLEAERADRISRLAGLERVSTARQTSNPSTPFTGPGVAGGGGGGQNQNQIPGYFDQNGNPVYTTRMVSTVGSASATGSVGGRTTTWASGTASQRGETEEGESEVGGGGRDGDTDVMSMDANFRDMDERDRYSVSAMDEDDGMSDDTSLVGFGEGAGSTMSGPTYSGSRKDILLGRSVLAREGSATGSTSAAAFGGSARGETSGSGADTTAERILRERLGGGEAEAKKPVLGSPEEAGLGKFYFEEKK